MCVEALFSRVSMFAKLSQFEGSSLSCFPGVQFHSPHTNTPDITLAHYNILIVNSLVFFCIFIEPAPRLV